MVLSRTYQYRSDRPRTMIIRKKTNKSQNGNRLYKNDCAKRKERSERRNRSFNDMLAADSKRATLAPKAEQRFALCTLALSSQCSSAFTIRSTLSNHWLTTLTDVTIYNQFGRMGRQGNAVQIVRHRKHLQIVRTRVGRGAQRVIHAP